MKIDLYQIDAFTDRLFSGNPAAVCPLTEFLPENTMQAIASENNLSETAFFVKNDEGYRIRWFTPTNEVNLCGHATLASAFVIFSYLDIGSESITFESKSGALYVTKQNDGRIQLDFPAINIEEIELIPDLVDALGMYPKKMYKTREKYLVIYEHEHQISSINPDFNKLLQLDLRGVIISSKSSNQFDFVSRNFSPKMGIPEDPVTGSAHCILTPYWANKLRQSTLRAKQLSARGGELFCELNKERVYISGKAILYMKGEVTL